MNCPKCGKENKDGTQLCEFCESPLTQTSAVEEKVEVRTSRLAIASLLFAMLSLITVPLFLWLLVRTHIPWFAPPKQVAAEILYLGSIMCIIMVPTIAGTLGIVSLIQIGLSGGKIAGRGLAAIGIGIPTILFFILFISPLLARTRCYAFKDTCGTRLSGIGKAMLIYANDYEDEFPRAGGRLSIWSGPVNWTAPDRRTAYSLAPDNTGGKATISSSFYLLVKYAEVTPKSFVCMNDTGITEWNLSSEKLPRPDFELIDAWDFGTEPQKHCSYSYHIPYGRFALTTSGDPGMAVAADRNPWTDSPFAKAKNFSRFKPDISPWNGTYKEAKWGNTPSHKDDGQNVLFLDSHVSFKKLSFCGIKDDNIYTSWNGDDKKRGLPPVLGSQPADKQDSLLVNDPGVPPAKPRRTWWGWRR